MIDNDTTASLRARFNPDGSPLRAHQMRMLDILIYIDRICRDNNIDYWLSSGTLLGAVRHGGFIPWDDDVDIEMLHGDYLRLVSILKSDQNRYILQDSSTDPGFLFPFAKLRDRDSSIAEADGLDAGQKFNGVYVDIFPLTPSSSRGVHHLASRILGTELKFRASHPHATVANRLLKGILHGIAFPLLRVADNIGFRQCLRHAIPSYFLAPRSMPDLLPTVDIEFEGHKFRAPHDTPAYLTRLYGNYMALPDADNIHPHTSTVKLW